MIDTSNHRVKVDIDAIKGRFTESDSLHKRDVAALIHEVERLTAENTALRDVPKSSESSEAINSATYVEYLERLQALYRKDVARFRDIINQAKASPEIRQLLLIEALQENDAYAELLDAVYLDMEDQNMLYDEVTRLTDETAEMKVVIEKLSKHARVGEWINTALMGSRGSQWAYLAASGDMYRVREDEEYTFHTFVNDVEFGEPIPWKFEVAQEAVLAHIASQKSGGQ